MNELKTQAKLDNTFDGFISYRRSSDGILAKWLKLMLESTGTVKIFLDLDNIRQGRFDERIRSCIEKSSNFILILSNESIKRLDNHNDWVMAEIRHALANEKRIIPILVDEFRFPSEERMSEELNAVSKFNGVHYSLKYAEEAIKTILDFMELTQDNKKKGISRLSILEESRVNKLSENHGLKFCVNRVSELKRMNNLLVNAINSNSARCALIEGEFGVGKSTLINEFIRNTDKSDINIFAEKCSKESEMIGLNPFIKLMIDLVQYFYIDIGDDYTVETYLSENAPAWLDLCNHEIPAINKKSLIEFRQKRYSLENIFLQFCNVINKVIKKSKAIVIIIDDIHWADTTTLNLVSFIIKNLSNSPLLLLLTYRPFEAFEVRIASDEFKSFRSDILMNGGTNLKLESGIQAENYIKMRYPLNRFDPKISIKIQNITQGHPLYISQIFSYWEENDLLQSSLQDDGNELWYYNSIEKLFSFIPNSLSQVLNERIKLLDKSYQDTLVFASVEGERFTAQLVSQELEIDEFDLFERFEILESRYKLITEAESKLIGSLALDYYRFGHKFFQESLYNQLSYGKKRLLHKKIANGLENLNLNKEIAPQLAFHYNKALVYDKAVKYSLLAADLHKEKCLWIECQYWCEFGLNIVGEVLDNEELILQLIEMSGLCFYLEGSFLKSYKRYLEALDIVKRQESSHMKQIEIIVRLAELCDELNRIDEGMKFLVQGENLIAETTVEASKIIKLKVIDGLLNFRIKNTDYAIQKLKEAIKEAEEIEISDELTNSLVIAYDILGISLGNKNKYLEAEKAFKMGVALSKSAEDKRWESDCLLNLAFDYIDLRKISLAKIYTEEALEISKKIGDNDHIAYAYANLGLIYLYKNQLNKALDFISKSIELSLQIDSIWNLPYSYTDLARVYLKLNDFDQANSAIAEALKYASDNEFVYGYILETYASIDMVMNKSTSKKKFEKAIQIYLEAGHEHFASRTRVEFAHYYNNIGENDEAISLLKKAIKTFNRLEIHEDLKIAKSFLNRILA